MDSGGVDGCDVDVGVVVVVDVVDVVDSGGVDELKKTVQVEIQIVEMSSVEQSENNAD